MTVTFPGTLDRMAQIGYFVGEAPKTLSHPEGSGFMAVHPLNETCSLEWSSSRTPRQVLPIDLRQGAYRVREAATEQDLLAAFRLRFTVFNVELNEGLEQSSATGFDTDQFDPVCDHLIVECANQVVGTYRLHTGSLAKANLSYYGEREFDFTPYESIRNEVIELGRACIHRDHRSTEVLYLLWRGIAEYASRCGGRYLLGCSSLTSQDAAQGFAVYEALKNYLAAPEFRTTPQQAYLLPPIQHCHDRPHIPKLLRTYLAIGAKICGPPAIDRDFKTIDFLTLLDLENLHPRIRARFFPNK
jgi:putative hemolysin